MAIGFSHPRPLHRAVAAAALLGILACEVPGPTEGTNRPPIPATDPVPADGASGVQLAPLLEWRGGTDPDGDPVVFAVFLGLAEPLPLVGTTSGRRFETPERLTPDTEIRWRVVSSDSRGATSESATWSFRTSLSTPEPNEPPTAPGNPDPADGAIDVAPGTPLRWSPARDPEMDAIRYDVHLGRGTEPLPLVATVADTFFIAPEAFDHATSYSWQVIARDEENATPGPSWRFTTASPPNEPPSPPSAPSPADQATGIEVGIRLSWSGGADPDLDAVAFDIYLGDENPPPFAATLTAAGYDPPGDLEYETIYFWRVVARDGEGATASGPIWSFVTGTRPNQPPSVPSDPDPANGAAAVPPDIVLRWSGGADPDGDPVTFHVYLGRDDPPAFAALVTEATFDPPGTLDAGTIYYWRVVAVDIGGAEISGGTWIFTTAP